MSDNSNLTQEKFQKAIEFSAPIFQNEMPAATIWLKYDKISMLSPGMLSPDIGEWCLWSMVYHGERHYFTGALFEAGHLIMLDRNGCQPVFPNDTLYFAHINKMVFPEMSKDEDKLRGIDE